MKINEVIVEASPDEDLRQEVLDTIGHPSRDPYYRYVDVNAVVNKAKPHYNKTKVTKGRAVHIAMQELYPELENGPVGDDNDSKKKRRGQRDATKTDLGGDTGYVTRDRTGSDGRSLQHDRYYNDDGSDLFPGISNAIKKAGDAVRGAVPGAEELTQYAKRGTKAYKRGFNAKIPSLKK